MKQQTNSLKSVEKTVQTTSVVVMTPVSAGEAFDKYAISLIKGSRLEDFKSTLALEESTLLRGAISEYVGAYDWKKDCLLLKKLVKCNEDLWDAENEIRRIIHEDPDNLKAHVECSNQIRLGNEVRASIKAEINKKNGSKLYELKSYEGFDLEV